MKIKGWAYFLMSAYLTVCHATVEKSEITNTDSPGSAWQQRSPLPFEHLWEDAYLPSAQQLTLREKLARDLSAKEPLYYAPRQRGQAYPLDGIRMQAMHPDEPSPYGARPEKRLTGHLPRR